MKKNVLIIFLILSVFNAISQEDTTKIAFVAYWSIGDSYDFRITKVKKSWKGDELVKSNDDTYIANFMVMDSTESSYTIKWSFKKNLGSSYQIPEDVVKKLSKYELTEVIYKTDELGTFIEVVNWKELSMAMKSMLDDILLVYKEKEGTDLKPIIQSMQPIIDVYSSKEGIEELVLKELQLMHIPMGGEFDILEPILYEEEIPNLFGGEPITGDGKLYFENVDFESGFCIMKQESDMDPDKAMETMKVALKKMGFDDETLKETLADSKFDIKDRNTYEYYYNPGVPHKIVTNREIIFNIGADKRRKVEKYIVELIYSDEE